LTFVESFNANIVRRSNVYLFFKAMHLAEHITACPISPVKALRRAIAKVGHVPSFKTDNAFYVP
jgi:hypothetical protein